MEALYLAGGEADERVAVAEGVVEGAAGLDEEGARAHGRVADLEAEDLGGRGAAAEGGEGAVGDALAVEDEEVLEDACEAQEQEAAVREEGGRGDDEADRLDVAEPLLVGAEGGVVGHQEGLRGRSISPRPWARSSWERDLSAGT